MISKLIEAHLRLLEDIATSTCPVPVTIRTHYRREIVVCRKPPQPGRGRGRPRKTKD